MGTLVQRMKVRRTTAKSLGAMMGSQVLTAIISITCGVLQARFVSPDTFGYFNAFAILGGYLTFLHMGSLTALARDYPYWMGKGDAQKARNAAAVSLGWVLLICAGLALLYLVLVAVNLIRGDYRAAAGWGANLVIASLVNYSLYLGCTYRTNDDFIIWSKVSVAGALVSVLTLPLVAWLGFWGLCLRLAIPTAFQTALSHRWRPLKIRPRLDFREFWAQVRFGLPMDLAGFFSTSCMAATLSAMVLAKYGVGVLGLFAFARYGETVIQQFGLSIAQVFAPKISQQMGATEDLRVCARYAAKATAFGTAVALGAIVAGTLVAHPVTGWLTPAYIEAVPMFQVLLWAGLYPVLTIPSHALMADRCVYPVAAANMVSYGVFALLGGAVVWASLPYVYIAVAYVTGKIAAVMVCYVTLWLRLRARRAADMAVAVAAS